MRISDWSSDVCSSDLLDRKARLPQRALVSRLKNLLMRRAIVGQDAESGFIVIGAQPLDMRGERLPHSLIIVEEANFLADELDNPDRGSVGLCASPADIPYRPNRHQRVGSNPAYPVIRPRLRQ